jgi:hypothetical protein
MQLLTTGNWYSAGVTNIKHAFDARAKGNDPESSHDSPLFSQPKQIDSPP